MKHRLKIALATRYRVLTNSVSKTNLPVFKKFHSHDGKTEPIENDPGGPMSNMTKAVAVATENRARQAALGFALCFASFVLLTQFVRAFFG